MENGRNIRSAIEVSCETINNELSREFKRALEDVKVGRSIDEALKELGERIPSNYINNIILSLEEANKLGVSVTDSINRQLSLINENRTNYEKRILKGIPLHLAILCILCFTAMVTVLVVFNR
jgi:pilus assembly protein TadC